MSANNSKKGRISAYVLITIVGCVLACSSIIPNDYLKLVVAMGTLFIGIYGIMRGLSNPGNTEESPTTEK